MKYQLNSIPDNVVHDYLDGIRNKLAEEETDSFSELTRFLSTLGADSQLASYIKTNYNIHTVDELKNITKDQLSKAFSSINSNSNFDDFYNKLNAFFSTYNK